MLDPTVPEAAVDAVLSAYPPAEFPQVAVNAHGILDAAAPRIGAAYLRWAAQQIRDTCPTPITAIPDSGNHTYSIGTFTNTGTAVFSSGPPRYTTTGPDVADWLDYLADHLTAADSTEPLGLGTATAMRDLVNDVHRRMDRIRRTFGEDTDHA